MSFAAVALLLLLLLLHCRWSPHVTATAVYAEIRLECSQLYLLAADAAAKKPHLKKIKKNTNENLDAIIHTHIHQLIQTRTVKC